MTKLKIALSGIAVVLIILFISNSIYITLGSVVALAGYYILFSKKINKDKETIDHSVEMIRFTDFIIDHYGKNNEFLIKEAYEHIEVDINKKYLIPLDVNNEEDLLTNLKVFFKNQYFDRFVDIYLDKSLTDNKKKDKLIYCNETLKDIFTLNKLVNEAFIKKSKKGMLMMFISLLVLVLLRVIFEEKYIIFATNVGGIIVLSVVSFLVIMCYQNYLNNVVRGLRYEKVY